VSDDALFHAEDGVFVPSALSRGPWSADALHGGPVAALLAHLAEGADAPGAMHPARLTVELLRPVPLAPLRPAVRVLRPGRKVQLVEAALFAGEREVARGTLLRLRRAHVALPAGTRGGPSEPPPPPSASRETNAPWRGAQVAYHSHATEHRLARGAWGMPGPCTDWIRLTVPLLPGVPPSPLVRVAAAADFGNGIGSALPYEAYTFLNADLTIHLHRLPENGEWVCLDAATWPDEAGVAVAESVLYDERGRLGRALQSVLLEPR
jgi:hypothetical protein